MGGGAAGLSTAAALERRGLAPIVLDKDERIGGTWARRYERLSLHTIRRFSGLAHRPLPRHYPKYVPKDLYAEYLEDYADSFGLDVRLNTPVRTIRSAGRLWEIESNGTVLSARVAIVATGHYNEPVMPRWPGDEDFGGRLLHSHAYRSGREFEGSRALVIGIGNSGAEIATDLVEQGASSVAISVRTSPPIVPRDLFGIVPVQLFGIALHASARARALRPPRGRRCAGSAPATSRRMGSARLRGARSQRAARL